MPLLVGLLIVVATVYQLFFRYEHWPSHDKDGVFYEHDNLTGDTHAVKPGARASVFARIIGGSGGDRISSGDEGFDSGSGHYFESVDRDNRDNDYYHADDADNGDSARNTRRIDLSDSRAVARAAKPVPVPKDVVVASSAPPVPMAMLAMDGDDDAKDGGKPFAVRQVDLNQDGSTEEIIQNAVEADGKLDISIVKQGREIFYGRGLQIALLPTRSDGGWSDIALKTSRHTLKVYRYNVSEAAYKPLKTDASGTAALNSPGSKQRS